MVRSQRYLEIIEEEQLVENARVMGGHLLQRLNELATEFPQFVSNARALGLFAAFDMPDKEARDKLKSACYENGLIILPSGERSIRFRPPLNISRSEIDLGISIIRDSLKQL
jgi:L-lysine 6-transaminase